MLSARDGAVVHSIIGGFVQKVHFERLASEAAQANAVISLLFRPGQFVGQGETIARVLPAQCVKAMGPSVVGAVQLGRHRNLDQDLEFAIAQLVEIALRALSPAINDTYTALYCIDWLGGAIRGLVNLPEPTGVWSSEDGKVSVLFPPLQFRDIVKTAFDLLRQASIGKCGSQDLSAGHMVQASTRSYQSGAKPIAAGAGASGVGGCLSGDNGRS